MENLDKILEFQNQLSINKARELGQIMFEKMFSSKDIDISYRTISHWAEKGVFNNVLNPEKEPGKWRDFSFVDVIWIEFVQEIRKLGYTLPQILLFKTVFYDPIDKTSFINEMKTKRTEDMTSSEKKIFKNQTTELKETQRLINLPPERFTFNQKVSHLAIAILQFVILREESVFHIYDEGSFSRFNPDEESISISDLLKTHISVSLSTVMQKYISRDKNLNKISLMTLTKEEVTVLHHLRTGNLKSLKVNFDNKSSINIIETTEVLNDIKPETRFLEAILKNGYQDISFSTQNGKITTFKRTTKHKVN